MKPHVCLGCPSQEFVVGSGYMDFLDQSSLWKVVLMVEQVGRVAGPFNLPHVSHLHISPFAVIHKTHPPGKCRLIFNMSSLSARDEVERRLVCLSRSLFKLRSAPFLFDLVFCRRIDNSHFYTVSPLFLYVDDFLIMRATHTSWRGLEARIFLERESWICRLYRFVTYGGNSVGLPIKS